MNCTSQCIYIIEEARLTIRAKEREVEVAQEQAEIDIKHTTQQMKHLQYENQTRIGEIRAEAMTQLKLAQEDHGLQELELLNDKRELRRLLREKEEINELQLQQLKMKHSELLRFVEYLYINLYIWKLTNMYYKIYTYHSIYMFYEILQIFGFRVNK